MDLNRELGVAGRIEVGGVPEGVDARLVAGLVRAAPTRPVIHVARDDARLARVVEALMFFAPEVEVVALPAWDCLPYDRVSPNPEIVARRIDALTRLATTEAPASGRVVVTTVAGVLQRLPTRDVFKATMRRLAKGTRSNVNELVEFLRHTGYRRADTVREAGEFALRGGILDVFPPGAAEPLRLDFFGDEIDGIRSFDPMTQLTTAKHDQVLFQPVSEAMLDPASIQRFRSGYRGAFGADTADPLYEAVSAGRHHAGMEHWLPLFHEKLELILDYLPDARVTLDPEAEPAFAARFEMIQEYFDARKSMGKLGSDEGLPYKPLPPDRLYPTPEEWQGLLLERPYAAFTPFVGPGRDAGGRAGHDFAAARAAPEINLYDAVRQHLATLASDGKRVSIAAFTQGSADRLSHLLNEHGVESLVSVVDGKALDALTPGQTGIAVLGLERGFTHEGVALIAEADILGERLSRPPRRRRKGEDFLKEASTLSEGDFVVHIEHGIGRYDGLVTLEVSGAPHDCLRVLYAGGDKLFVPVENIEVL